MVASGGVVVVVVVVVVVEWRPSPNPNPNPCPNPSPNPNYLVACMAEYVDSVDELVAVVTGEDHRSVDRDVVGTNHVGRPEEDGHNRVHENTQAVIRYVRQVLWRWSWRSYW